MKRIPRPAVSKPTLCLICHLVVVMPKGKDSWQCPKCGELYPFKWWKIREHKRDRKPKQQYEALDYRPSP